MIILSANNISKSYGVEPILTGVSFHVNEGDRIGVIGANGAGKTTLLNILAGKLSFESGEYFLSAETTLGYLHQRDEFRPDRTVYEEAEAVFAPVLKLEEEIKALSEEIARQTSTDMETENLIHKLDALQEEFARRDGYRYRSEIVGILGSMAFGEDFYDKKIATLSGGERTRLSLACLLLRRPDVLFLDEPTNHLDIGMLKWLEQYLSSYPGTILLISHDRYFLDQTVNRIFEVENHKVYTYEGNYSTFAEKKRLRREEDFRKFDQQRREITRQEEMIRRFKQHGTEKLAKRAQSREKRLEKVELLEKPSALPGKMKIHFKQKYKSGNDVLLGEGLSKSFGSGQERRQLFFDVNFDIKRGEKICIVGPNGIGKTTLLKIMMDELAPDGGHVKIGHNVAFGYYDQNQQGLTAANTVLEELKESYRLYSDTEMRSILGRFLFQNDAVFLPVSALSGGEKARLSLVKLMLSGSNVLIMDEPTNHLDIASKEVFEDAVSEFPGTVIVVSHDRYFLSKIPDRIFELGETGITTFLGTYNYYVEKKQALASGKKYLEELSGKGEDAPLSGSAAQEQRRLGKEKEGALRKRQRLERRLEEEIKALESEASMLEAEMCKEENATDHKLLSEYGERLTGVRDDISRKYEEWLAVQEEADF